jgi:hypothetical protein
MTRRWSWRQGVHTLTLPESTSIEFNVDGLPPETSFEVSPSAARSSSWCRASRRHVREGLLTAPLRMRLL